METDRIRELSNGQRAEPPGVPGNGRAGAEDEFGDDMDAEMMDLMDRTG